MPTLPLLRSLLLGCAGVLAVLCAPKDALAQEPTRGFRKDNLQFRMGGSMEFIPIDYKIGNPVFQVPAFYYGVAFGSNYVLAHSNDVWSVSADANVHFAFSYSTWGGSGVNLMAQIPAYIKGKVGATATRYNESFAGFGMGIGFNYTFIMLPYADGSDVRKLNTGFIAPAAMAEVTLRLGGEQFLTIRGHLNLIGMDGELEPEVPGDQPTPIVLNNWGIGFMYDF